MSIPNPRPGLVVRYSFLWSTEQEQGAIEGSKDRPCAIVAAASQTDDGSTRTIVAPITHSPPIDPDTSLEIPANVCRSLSLDGESHWLRFDELNSFIWPGYDLRARRNGAYDYGMLPRALFEELKDGIIAEHKRCRARLISRDG